MLDVRVLRRRTSYPLRRRSASHAACKRGSHTKCSSSPGPRNVHRPSSDTLAYTATQVEICLHTSSLRFWSQSMSLYIDMKMIRPFELVWMYVLALAHLLCFGEKLNRCVSWVNALVEPPPARWRCRSAGKSLGSRRNEQLFASPELPHIFGRGCHFPPRHNTDSMRTYTFDCR